MAMLDHSANFLCSKYWLHRAADTAELTGVQAQTRSAALQVTAAGL